MSPAGPPPASGEALAAEPPAGLALLLGRHSLGARHLAEPAPDDTALAWALAAARRAPDHGGLRPYRLLAIRGPARAALGALFAAAARDAGKPPEDADEDGRRAAAAPLTLALLARLDPGHPLAPAHEQWMAIGAALANLLNALHAQGWAGKMLSGGKVRSPRVQAAFCGPGEQLVGWIVLGRPTRPPRARTPGRPAAEAPPEPLLQDWQPPG